MDFVLFAQATQDEAQGWLQYWPLLALALGAYLAYLFVDNAASRSNTKGGRSSGQPVVVIDRGGEPPSQPTFGEQEVNINPPIKRRIAFGYVPAGYVGVMERWGYWSDKVIGRIRTRKELGDDIEKGLMPRYRRGLGRFLYEPIPGFMVNLVPNRELSVETAAEHIPIGSGLELLITIQIRFWFFNPAIFLTLVEDTNYAKYISKIAREVAARVYRSATIDDWRSGPHEDRIESELRRELRRIGVGLMGIATLPNVTPEHASTFAMPAQLEITEKIRAGAKQGTRELADAIKDAWSGGLSDDAAAAYAAAIMQSSHWTVLSGGANPMIDVSPPPSRRNT